LGINPLKFPPSNEIVGWKEFFEVHNDLYNNDENE
jgi:hypothetical protein